MKFYVYEWYDNDTQEVFYVGKGCKNRYKNTSDRNKLFKEYIKNHSVDVRIIQYFEKEEDAFEYEQMKIKEYKEKGLCQCCLMYGGYGGWSKVWTPEMREYMSRYNPMKDNKQRKRMSKENPMKNKEIAKKNGKSKKRAVIINGVEYEGTVDAARDLGVWENTILNWCKRGYDTNYNPCRYKDEEQKAYIVKRTSSKAVLIDGVYYESLKAAAKALGVKDTSPLCKALKANRPYRGHKCEYANQQPS